MFGSACVRASAEGLPDDENALCLLGVLIGAAFPDGITISDPTVFRSYRKLDFTCPPSSEFPLPYKVYTFIFPSENDEDEPNEGRIR